MPDLVDETSWALAKAEIHNRHPELAGTEQTFWCLVKRSYRQHVLLSKGGEAGTTTTGTQRSLAKRYWFQGMPISIENEKGSYRAGVDKDGHEWKNYMHFDYGYIRGTEGADGEHLDVYVGGDEAATHVYVVHQVVPASGKYDEDKVMIGFSNEKSAKAAYLKQYDSPKFFGGMRSIPVDAFKIMLRVHKGKRLTTGQATRFLVKSEHVPNEVAVNLEWEPPGGTHPQTWRAMYGGKYVYRRAKPGVGVDIEESGKLYTSEEKKKKEQEAQGKGEKYEEEKKTLRQQSIKMTPEQHKKEADKPGASKTDKDFHRAEAQKKLDLGALRDKLQNDASHMVTRTTETGESESVVVGKKDKEAA